jgi:glycosyltransferase involved in cell wall biosynthesis
MGVTIITPAFNAARYIVETVESVLTQLQEYHQDFEYIVLDDGSLDNTLDKLKPYLNQLTIISRPNRGEQSTVNEGIKLAKHDIVAVVNADDPIYPGLVNAAVKMLTENTELVAVYPDWNKIDSMGNVIEAVYTHDFDYNSMIEQYCCIPGPGTFFRKSALKEELPRNPLYRYSGDFELWLRLGLRGPMARMPKFLATWRHHEEGASQMCINPEMAENRVAVMKGFFSRIDLPTSILSKKRQAMSSAYYQAGILAIHNRAINGRKYLALSILYKPWWPRNFFLSQRRNWLYIFYIYGAPVTTLLYRILLLFRNRKNK